MKKLNLNMMTKQLANTVAKETEARSKKPQANSAVKPGGKKSKKSK